MRITKKSMHSAGLAAGLMLLAGVPALRAQTAGSPILSIPTTTLNFAYQSPGQSTLPPAQTMRLFSNPAGVSYTATASTSIGGSWLFVNNLTQFSGNTGTTGQDLVISVSPTTLTTGGLYFGTVILTSGTATLQINVTLSVSTTPQLIIAPSSIPLQVVDANTTLPITLTVQSSNGTPVQFQAATPEGTNGAAWLSVAPNPATAPGTVSLIINSALLGGSTGSGVVRFTPLGGSPVSVPISVQAAAAAQLQVVPTTLLFPYQPGGSSVPTAKTVNVSSTTQTQLTYSATVAGANPYVALSSNSISNTTTLTGLQTPSSFSVVPNISALPAGAGGGPPAAGNYDTTVTVTASNGQTQNITARVVVTTTPVLTANPDALSFTYAVGGVSPVAQAISVGSTGAVQFYTAQAVFPAGTPAFFSVPSNQAPTPSPVNVTLVPSVLATLTGGTTYSGVVRLQSTTAGSVPVDVPVTLTVSGTGTGGTLTVDDPSPAAFTGLVGAPQTARTTTIRSTNNVAQNFSVTVTYTAGQPTGWVAVTPNFGTTPSVLTYNVDSTQITTAGNYTANIVITPTSGLGSPIQIPIQYNVGGGATASPERFDLTQVGNTPPGQQTVTLSSTVTGLQYIPTVASPNSDPIFVVPSASGTVPGTLTFTLNSQNLTPRATPYLNNIVLIFNQGGQNLTIPVSLTVSAGGTIQVSPSTPLNFQFQTGGSAPANQTISLISNGVAVPFTAAASTTTGGNWLTVTPASGTAPAAGGTPVPLSISIVPSTGLTAGSYTGTVTITPSNGGTPIPVTVNLTVTTPNPPNNLSISNTGSGISRGVSPGEIITIKGRNAAPSVGMSFTLQNGTVPTRLGEVRVIFDNQYEAPLLYVGPSGDRSSDQINLIVPYGISGRFSTNMVVEYRGVAAQAIPLAVRDTEPGLFTVNQAGTGPAALLNQNSSTNTQSNPATPGSVVQIFGTGEGLISPQPATGGVIPTTAPFPQLLASNVQVKINGVPTRIFYAGAAPGLVAGVFQINAEVPNSLTTLGGTQQVSLEVQIGSTSSQPGVTLWVRGNQ